MTVGELLARISSRELTEWLCYFEIEGPPGDGRADWRAALVASTIANVNRDPKKQAKAYKAEDFMPQWEPDERRTTNDENRPEQTVEQQAGLARMLARTLGGQIEVGE